MCTFDIVVIKHLYAELVNSMLHEHVHIKKKHTYKPNWSKAWQQMNEKVNINLIPVSSRMHHFCVMAHYHW